MYSRHLHPLVCDMLGEFRIVYVTGPRQSGKTTLVRSIAADLGMRYLTLDDRGAQVATITFQLKRLVGGRTRQGPHPIE